MIGGLPRSEVARRLAAAKMDDDDVAFFDEWQHWFGDDFHLHEPV